MVYIVGTGAMGGAIAKALAKAGQKVFVYDRNFQKAKVFAKGTKIIADKDFKNFGKANWVIVAVKPQDVMKLSHEIKPLLKPSTILISVAAGLRIKKLKALFQHEKVARFMPTLAFTVGQGDAMWVARGLNDNEKTGYKNLLKCFTDEFEVKDESLLDVGGVVYGAAKAFYLLLAQYHEKAAVKYGIEYKRAHKLIKRTFLGAALLEGEYSDLINRVATKKGVTRAALDIFYRHKFDKIVEEAVRKGIKRTRELSNG